MSTAYRFGYTIVFITLQSRDIHFLARNNIHNVPADKIRQMNSRFADVEVPYFYGWSVPKIESLKLRDSIKNMLIKCQENVPSFKDILLSAFHTTAANALATYNLRLASSKDCHVTAAFIDEGKIPGSMHYYNSKKVKDSLGSVAELKVVGWCITPRSLFCRIKLSDEQKQLWGRNDSASGERNDISFESTHTVNRNTLKLLEDLTLQASTPTDVLPNVYTKPNHGIGCTAHITLGVASGLRPVAAKDDLFQLVHLELHTNCLEEHQLGNILLRQYPKNVWTAFLKRPKHVPAIFCAHYKH